VDLIFRIQAALPALCRSEVRVGQILIKNPHKFAHLKITEIANLAHTSSTTVIRFCNHVGYAGFFELKSKILSESYQEESSLHDVVQPSDSVSQVVIKSIDNATATMMSCASSKLAEDVERVAAEIANVRSHNGIIHIYAFGGSSSLALDLQHKLILLGFKAQAIFDDHLQAVASCLLGKYDVAIFVSQSGETSSLIQLAGELNERGVKTISVSPQKTTLSQVCPMKLHSFHKTYKSELQFENQITQFLIVDILVTVVGLKMLDERTKKTQSLQKKALTRRRLHN
jgi:RpiR family transcriptional regulator, carbohydrate utilization regulator